MILDLHGTGTFSRWTRVVVPGPLSPEPAREHLGLRAGNLTAISMDMCGGYAKSVRRHAPQAEIVIANYHGCHLARKALDKVRRQHWLATR